MLPGEGATWVREQLRSALIDPAHEAEVCGVSFGGAFDFAQQRCRRSFHVDGWADFPLSEWLAEAVGLPVVTDNDANVAAIGEFNALKHPAPSSLLYVTISTGVGAGFVLAGEVVRGDQGLAGELGHIDIGHAQECSCGQRGCLERAVSGYWIQSDNHVSAEVFLNERGNFNEWINALGKGLWAAILMLDPSHVVLGGGMASQGRRLQQGLQDYFDARSAAIGRFPPRVAMGDPSGRSVLLGAALLAEEVFA
jgi:predicted NBD/HSP70 family sugar kinase